MYLMVYFFFSYMEPIQSVSSVPANSTARLRSTSRMARTTGNVTRSHRKNSSAVPKARRRKTKHPRHVPPDHGRSKQTSANAQEAHAHCHERVAAQRKGAARTQRGKRHAQARQAARGTRDTRARAPGRRRRREGRGGREGEARERGGRGRGTSLLHWRR